MNLLSKFSQNKPMQFHPASILLRKVKLQIEEKMLRLVTTILV